MWSGPKPRHAWRIAVAACVVLATLYASCQVRVGGASWSDARLLPVFRLYRPAGSASAEASSPLREGGHGENGDASEDTAIHDALLSDEAAQPDKVVVMAKLEDEDTSWVGKHLPDWQAAIYTVNNRSAALHTQANKGRESMAYLTYIIDNYPVFPSTVAFLHPARDGYPAAWHNDAPDYDNVWSLRQLRLDHVRRSGYVNLRCIWIPGCPDEIQPYRDPAEEHRVSEHITVEAWRYLFNETAPARIGQTCCGQFAVSREQILARPLADYRRFRAWVLATPASDAVSGRVMEYAWHVIFGKEAVL
ncbi:MAG: hypothetical protein M1832_000267 [Thelocarpon impressellum]|nr:MAG: hypothetical protein M1832_000267 [Thelocarpon impressellum]